ncbi:MAG: Gfo/Idh/MocA family protein [Candidatus Latescibacterota bacterium]
MSEEQPTRRTFMKTAAVAAGAAAVGSMAPSSALGANDRVAFGSIGLGGMGTGHLQSLVKRSKDDNIQVLGLSDVYQRRLTRAATICKEAGYTAEQYIDYRKLLDNKDIDAVLIATPDHWHAKMAIEAMEAGKHVYVEKPITLTIEQAIAVRSAVKRYNKCLQVGPQRTSEARYWKAQQEIREGKVGKVTMAQGSFNRNVRECAFNKWFKIDEGSGPHATGEDYINWDLWLGHEWGLAPKIPFNPEHMFRFRKYFLYNGGVATDLLYHYLAPLLLAIVGENGAYPRRVSAGGGLYVYKDGRDIPDVFAMVIDYPQEFSVYLASWLTNDTQVPTRIYGQCGTIEFPESQPTATYTGNGDFAEDFRKMHDGNNEVILTTQNQRDMEGNLIDAIRQGTKLFCNVDLGVATMVAIKMGVEAYRQGKAFYWDDKNEKIV